MKPPRLIIHFFNNLFIMLSSSLNNLDLFQNQIIMTVDRHTSNHKIILQKNKGSIQTHSKYYCIIS